MSHRIVSKKQLSEDVFTAEIEAPLIAQARRPGQFVIVSLNNEYAERIPLTIAGFAGVLRAFWKPSSGAGRMGLFSAACLGSFLVAMLFTFFTVPAYAATKSTYALGLLPCFAVLMASGIGLIPRSAPFRSVVSGYVFSWLAFVYTAYFAW